MEIARAVGLSTTTVAVALLAGCGHGGAGAGAGAGGMPPPAVTTAAAVSENVPLYIDEPVGKATAFESVTVQPQVTGVLIARHFEDGADLHKGQLLFEIDPRPFVAALDQAKANLAQSKAAADFAQSDYQRYLNLRGTPAVSQEEIEQKQNTLQVAQATVEATQAAVETAQLNLNYCRISSPIDGRAGERLVDVGNVVTTLAGTSGGSNLLVINRVDPIYADFTVTEAELQRVQHYMSIGTLSVQVATPADMALIAASPAPAPTSQPAAAPGSSSADDRSAAVVNTPASQPAPFQPRTGKLVFLDNTVQDSSGTVKLRAQLPNADQHFWPGQFVNVRLVLTNTPSIMIPANAAQISQQGLFVYKVVDNPNSPTKTVAAMQPVTIGQRHGDMVVVESGLAAGDQIVSSGFTLLQPDAPIMVIGGAPAGPGAPGGGAAPAVTPGTLKSPSNQETPKTGPQAAADVNGKSTEGSHS